MIGSKKKGNRGENEWANWLCDHGIKAWKDGMSGGGNREKGDVGNNINCHFEIKTVKKLNLQEAWRQAEHGANMSHNTPYVVIRFDGMPKDRWLVVLDNWAWLDLITGEKSVEPAPATNDRELKWALDKAIRANKELLKIIGENN